MGVSQGAMGKMLGVDEGTVRSDLGKRRAGNPAPALAVPQGADDTDAGNPAPVMREPSGAEVARLAQQQAEKAHNHRPQGTGENEWYTPPAYLDLARAVRRCGELLSQLDARGQHRKPRAPTVLLHPSAMPQQALVCRSTSKLQAVRGSVGVNEGPNELRNLGRPRDPILQVAPLAGEP